MMELMHGQELAWPTFLKNPPVLIPCPYPKIAKKIDHISWSWLCPCSHVATTASHYEYHSLNMMYYFNESERSFVFNVNVVRLHEAAQINQSTLVQWLSMRGTKQLGLKG